MSKRFLNSEIWDKEEFLDSSPEQKLLFFYVVQRCSNIGVFDISLKMASFQLGFDVTREKVLSIPSDIEELKDGTFWLPKFCHHQYGELSETCKPHLRYISDLKKLGLFNRVCKGYAKGIQTLEEKEKEKEKDYYEEKFKIFWENYPKRNGNLVGKKATWEQFLKIQESEIETLIQNTKNYFDKVDHKFAKDPERFLKKDFWKDWSEKVPEKPKQKNFYILQEHDEYLQELGYEKYLEFMKAKDVTPMLNAKGEVI